MSLFDLILIHPIINLLLAIYYVADSLHIPYPLGFSIIGLTVAIRFILYPLINTQLKASKKMQELTPHISRLKEKHKSDAKVLQAETMRLYKEHGVNPAAGCLPILVQLPVIWALYTVLQRVVSQDPKTVLSFINSIAYTDTLRLSSPWATDFFGFPLGKTPSELLGFMPVVLLIPIITAVLQFIQAKMMVPAKVEQAIKKAEKTPKKEDDFAAVFQTQSVYLFPIMIGFFSYTFQIGLSLYWNTFTLFGILQQYKISGLGGLSDLKKIFKK